MSILGVSLFGPPDPAEVVGKHGPQVYRHLRRIFGPNTDIDDVYQNVFMEVLRSLPSFRGRSRLSTWIRRITWNVAYQEMRLTYRHKHLTELDEAAVAGREEPVDALAERNVAMGRLYAALEQIEPRLRAPVIMHDVEGRTLKEISRELGRPLPTVASQLYSGRERLARMMNRKAQAGRAGQRSPGREGRS